MARKTVVVVQRRLTHYRVPLFESLRLELRSRHIDLELLVGSGSAEEAAKADSGLIEWAKTLPTTYVGGVQLCWQPFGQHLKGKDLVVVTQENKLLYNHLLLLRPRRFRLAFWGHGADFQSNNPDSVRARFRRWTTSRVDWWFAYTQLSADIVTATGFPGEKVTVVNNAVDTLELSRLRDEITVGETMELREALGLEGGPVAVSLGSLYTGRQLDFLFAAALAVRNRVPGFHLLIVGDGPEREKVRAWCASNSWTHWVGARHGREKVQYLSMAQLMLNPGVVGLNILDSFALGLPIVTTHREGHGPEIAYLREGANGIMTDHDVAAYASAVTALLLDKQTLARLRAQCIAAAREYTLENMVSRFAGGIERAIN